MNEEELAILVPQEGFEPSPLARLDFESSMSAVPPPGHIVLTENFFSFCCHVTLFISKLAPGIGIEPIWYWLTASRHTLRLSWNIFY